VTIRCGATPPSTRSTSVATVRSGVAESRCSPGIIGPTLAACTATGLATAALAAVAYRLEVFLLVCVLITTIAAGLTWSGTAYFQGQRRLGLAAWTSQLSNWQLVPVAVITALLGHVTAAAPCVLITGAGVIAASAVWLHLVRREAAVAPQPDPGELLSEALSLVLIQTSSAAFLQLERLLIAPTVGLHELAVFGVLATLVGSPFSHAAGRRSTHAHTRAAGNR